MASLSLVNVIATTRINGSIDIEKLARLLEHVRYNPEKFVGLTWKLSKTATIITFSNGTISSYGTKSEIKAKQAIITALNHFKKNGCVNINVEIKEISIENIVGMADIGRRIELESIARLPLAIYEPDQFPGIIYRPFNDSRVCLIFGSGKLSIVGCKSSEQAIEMLDFTLKVISKTESRND